MKLLLKLIIVCGLVLLSLTQGQGASADYTDTQEFENTLQRVERWRPLVYQILADYELSDHLLVLSVIAQESHGRPYAISQDRYRSVGLMQITPRPWTGTSSQLRHPVYNVTMGIRILEKVLWQAEGDTAMALKAYNCGWARIEINPFCGDLYVEKVLGFWYPILEERWQALICRGKMCLSEWMSY